MTVPITELFKRTLNVSEVDSVYPLIVMLVSVVEDLKFVTVASGVTSGIEVLVAT